MFSFIFANLIGGCAGDTIQCASEQYQEDTQFRNHPSFLGSLPHTDDEPDIRLHEKSKSIKYLIF